MLTSAGYTLGPRLRVRTAADWMLMPAKPGILQRRNSVLQCGCPSVTYTCCEQSHSRPSTDRHSSLHRGAGAHCSGERQAHMKIPQPGTALHWCSAEMTPAEKHRIDVWETRCWWVHRFPAPRKHTCMRGSSNNLGRGTASGGKIGRCEMPAPRKHTCMHVRVSKVKSERQVALQPEAPHMHSATEPDHAMVCKQMANLTQTHPGNLAHALRLVASYTGLQPALKVPIAVCLEPTTMPS